ncbi:MAG: phosphoribosylpyrophosphate synthetase [Candidatus Coatesbacteria bacterium]|nr:MAG: phosphoribosylpyrophosphate synthetase [Candidatus Coatesbacteria bacterium]
MVEQLKVFTGNGNRPLARMICEYLNIPLGDADVGRFSDGEIMVQINENVRGTDVFVVQSMGRPVNEHLLELLLMIDALKRASAGRITAVLPYYCYARQDRKRMPRVPISAKLIADLLSASGADRVVSVDLHAGQIQGFFNVPFDHLLSAPVLAGYIQGLDVKDLVIVSPDAGGVERARQFARRLASDLAIIDKRRPSPNVSEVRHIIGDVVHRDVVLLDDMIDTGGTIANSAVALQAAGARRVFACCAHPVLSGQAYERLTESPIEKIITTDTIPVDKKRDPKNKIVVLSIAPLLGEAIKRINKSLSVSEMFQ